VTVEVRATGIELRCVACGDAVAGGATPRCPACGGRLEVVRRSPPSPFAADPAAAGIFRYASLLPDVPAAARVSLAEGRTPLLDMPAAGHATGLSRLLAKDESRNPTGTFKDRAMALAATVARAEGAAGIVCASTGNAGASAAAYGARAGLPVVILVPVGTPAAKMAQAAVCGARVIAVQGTYSDAWAMAAAVSASLGWLNATTTFTCPYVVEATRTVAYEIAEQLGSPDWVAVPIGAGPLLVGIREGFEDLRALGVVDRVPRLLALQPSGCAPIVRAFEEGAPTRSWGRPETVAGGLADPLAGYPEEGDVTVRAVVASGGAAIAVDDDATLAAISLLAGREGLFQEPAGAIAIAGVAEARRRGLLAEGDAVVACLTGTGLKDPHAASGGTAEQFAEVDSLASLERVLADNRPGR
jgi:threonine synthase